MRTKLTGIVGLVTVLTVIIGGCGGQAPVVPEDVYDVAEYVGDGHHGTKPAPDFLSLVPEIQTQAIATALRLGDPALVDRVPEKAVNWYRIPPVGVDRPLIVTLQPTADEDSDLYLFQGSATGYGAGATCLGASSRLPLGNTDRPNGYAPDWVALDATDSKGWPTAQVAVWGAAGGGSPKHYRIECDPVWGLTVDGAHKSGTVTYRNSHWYRFAVKAGHVYFIQRWYTSADGRMNVYAYLNRATRYLTANNGEVHPDQNGFCYLRLYGTSTVACPYGIEVDKM